MDKNIVSNAKNIIKSTMGGVAFCTRTLAGFAGTLSEVKKWKTALGITVKDINLDNVLMGWGKYIEDGKCAVLTTIYKVDENCEFIYEESTDKHGRKVYTKIPDFYVWDYKTKWTVSDCLDSVTRYFNKDNKMVTGLVRETPFIKQGGKLVESTDAEHLRRATDECRAAEEFIRASNSAE